LRRRIEKIVFRDVYDYAPTLQRLSTDITRLRDVGVIANHVLTVLSTTLGLEWATIRLDASSTLFTIGEIPPEEDVLHGTVAPLSLVMGDAVIGWLSVGPKRRDPEFQPEDMSLLRTVAAMVGPALENAILVGELNAQLLELERRQGELEALSARLMQIQEDDRALLAAELHDDPLQRAILLARELRECAPGAVDIGRWQSELDEIIVSLRSIAAGLRPAVLDDFGLEEGLERLLNEVRARSDLSAQFERSSTPPFGRLEHDLETTLYRVAQEGLANSLKHSGASQIRLSLCRDQRFVRLSIVDDGHGTEETSIGLNGGDHFGLLGLQERLRPWNGKLTIARAPAGGTVLSAEVPLYAVNHAR
jgi:signal transduction histidine kinase